MSVGHLFVNEAFVQERESNDEIREDLVHVENLLDIPTCSMKMLCMIAH